MTYKQIKAILPNPSVGLPSLGSMISYIDETAFFFKFKKVNLYNDFLTMPLSLDVMKNFFVNWDEVSHMEETNIYGNPYRTKIIYQRKASQIRFSISKDVTNITYVDNYGDYYDGNVISVYHVKDLIPYMIHL